MAEVNVFFLPVKEFCQRDVVTCGPDERVATVAELMRDRDVSSVVICEAGAPIGIVTDHDLRSKVVAAGADPNLLAARAIMGAPLIVIGEEDFLFEALYRMSHHSIHRVGVVDATGHFTGIIADTDILRLQTRSPQQLLREIEEARSVADLKSLHERVQGLVVHLVGTGVATRDLVRMIAHLNDRILLRLITLLHAQRFSDLPGAFAFVVLGSEGRGEQTLTTDQDNAILFGDDLSAADQKRLETFSGELIDALIGLGVPPCPGGIMARNAEWRRSLAGWIEEVDSWLTNPIAENVLKGSMFFDLRTLYGDSTLEGTLKAHITEHLRRDGAFLVRTAANVVRFKPPLGFFGGIKAEGTGEHRGMVDIKKAGIFAITEGVKVLALEAGHLGGGTRERIAALVTAKVLDQQQAEDLEASYNYLVYLRLRGQVGAIREGQKPSNYLTLDHLNRMETGRLRLALEGVGTFQDYLKRHFSLDSIR